MLVSDLIQVSKVVPTVGEFDPGPGAQRDPIVQQSGLEADLLVCVQVKPGSIPDTRTSLLRRSQPLPFTETPFKLRRFTQVSALTC